MRNSNALTSMWHTIALYLSSFHNHIRNFPSLSRIRRHFNYLSVFVCFSVYLLNVGFSHAKRFICIPLKTLDTLSLERVCVLKVRGIKWMSNVLLFACEGRQIQFSKSRRVAVEGKPRGEGKEKCALQFFFEILLNKQ